jgi:hypothetical protein
MDDLLCSGDVGRLCDVAEGSCREATRSAGTGALCGVEGSLWLCRGGSVVAEACSGGTGDLCVTEEGLCSFREGGFVVAVYSGDAGGLCGVAEVSLWPCR